MSTNVYFAHPIDQVTASEAIPELFYVIERALQQVEGVVVFDPVRAWRMINTVPNPSIQLANMRLIESSIDVVLVAAPAGVPTIGTWLEVNKAIDSRKRVVIVTDIAGSWALEYLAILGDVSVVYLNNPTETTHEEEIRRLIQQ